MTSKAALLAALGLGLATGLCGLRWGVPGSARLAAFPERLKPTAAVADRLTRDWEELYKGIDRVHKELKGEEPVTYVQGVDVIEPGWEWPPAKLANSYRSLLLRSENPDEQKTFVVLSRMRPWKLELQPLYVQYGGAFIYPVGAFLGAAHLAHLARVTSDMRHYLMNPADMGGLFVAGRLFTVLFNLGALWVLFDLGRKLGGTPNGLWAAAFYALCPLVVVNTHSLKPHAYAAFWTLAAARFAYAALGSGKTRAYLLSGLCAGVAAGSNFSFLIFAALPAAAWLGRRRPKEEWARVLAGCAAAVCVFAAANPYVLFAGRDFLWETTVYPTRRRPELMEALSLFGPYLARQMGLVTQLLAGVGLVAALRSNDPGRKLLGAVLAGAGLILWVALAAFWGFMSGPESLRFFYPLIGLGCLLAASLVCASGLPAWARALAVAAVLVDSGLRSGVYLVNLHRDGGPLGTRTQAAAWISANIKPGAKVGLTRYPQPYSTPLFRYDLYTLVVFEKPEMLDAARYPEYLVVDENGRGTLEASTMNSAYKLQAAFRPFEKGWGRIYDASFFANAAMYIYTRA